MKNIVYFDLERKVSRGGRRLGQKRDMRMSVE
jgi:hypothetical protein